MLFRSYNVIKHKNIDLITNEKIKDNEDHLLNEKVSYKSLLDLDNFCYGIKNNDINFDNLQSDNYISNSSDDEKEINK